MNDPIDIQVNVQRSPPNSIRIATLEWPTVKMNVFVHWNVVYMPETDYAIVQRKVSTNETPEWDNLVGDARKLVVAAKKFAEDNIPAAVLLTDQESFTAAFIKALDDTRAMANLVGAELGYMATNSGGKAT